MYTTKNTIKETSYNGLTPTKLLSNGSCDTILIVLEKEHHFPEHTSPRDTLLVMLEGDIVFYINGKEYSLSGNQIFSFPANEKHRVFANENSKFLIIR